MRLRAVLLLMMMMMRRRRMAPEPRPHLLLPQRLLLAVTLTRRRRRLTQIRAAARHLALLLLLLLLGARAGRIGRRRADSIRTRRVARALRPLMDAVEVIPAASAAKGVPLLILLVQPLMLRPVMRRRKARRGQRLSESTLNDASSYETLLRREISLSGTGTSALVVQLARRRLHARGPPQTREVRRRRRLPSALSRESRAAPLLTLVLLGALPHHSEAA